MYCRSTRMYCIYVQAHIERYRQRQQRGPSQRPTRTLTELRGKHESFELPAFGNGRVLRDYQQVGRRVRNGGGSII